MYLQNIVSDHIGLLPTHCRYLIKLSRKTVLSLILWVKISGKYNKKMGNLLDFVANMASHTISSEFDFGDS
jgi:hypothetical protein